MAEKLNWVSDARIFYEKKGMAKYISHLDTVQTFTRAIKRAKIPVWFTEGFNPRAFLSFASALSLGIESYCEICDIRLMEERDFAELAKKLDDALPPDIHIAKIAPPVHKTQEIAFTGYEISFPAVDGKTADLIERKLQSDEIDIRKKAKQGKKKIEKLVNIKENIREYSLENADDALILKVLLTSSMQNNVNPVSLIKSLTEGSDYDIDMTDTVKKQIYLENMEVFQ